MNRVCFLAKDPHWTFVWWELSAEAVKQITSDARDIAKVQFCFRVYDITDILFDGHNSHSHFDVDLQWGTDRWYLPISECNRVYCVEVGFKLADTDFVAAARSNPLYLPRDGPWGASEEQWSTITL